jgi:hypothetical protein
MKAYCLKCRKNVEIMSPKIITLKNGSLATQGVCPICLTNVYRLGKPLACFDLREVKEVR